ncbi:MAG: hypothetical protein HYV26_08145 [Candidatus Hydrogenedentes bacterium]|nr:hypothetical protein [Candidatus Hydrogenedentota bacterium]
MSGDSRLGVLDASLINQYKVGSITRFPADTNGDGFGPKGRRGPAWLPKDAAGVRTVSLPDDLSAAPGEAVDVPVLLDDAAGVLGYYLEIGFDAGALEYVETLSGSLTPGWGAPVVNAQAGRLLLAHAGAQALDGAGSLAVLRFRMLATAPGATALTLVTAKLNDHQLAVQTQDGLLSILDSAAEGEGEGEGATSGEGEGEGESNATPDGAEGEGESESESEVAQQAHLTPEDQAAELLRAACGCDPSETKSWSHLVEAVLPLLLLVLALTRWRRPGADN